MASPESLTLTAILELQTADAMREAYKARNTFEKILGEPLQFMGTTAKERQAAEKKVNNESRTANNNLLKLGLSVMFFGQAMKKTTEAWLRPAADAVGLFEIFSLAMELFFLPAMLAILPVFLWFLDTLSNAPEPVKLLIGALVGLGFVIGTVLAFLGQLALAGVGWNLLTAAVTAMTTAIGTSAGVGLLGALSLLLPIIAALAAAAYLANRGANAPHTEGEAKLGILGDISAGVRGVAGDVGGAAGISSKDQLALYNMMTYGATNPTNGQDLISVMGQSPIGVTPISTTNNTSNVNNVLGQMTGDQFMSVFQPAHHNGGT